MFQVGQKVTLLWASNKQDFGIIIKIEDYPESESCLLVIKSIDGSPIILSYYSKNLWINNDGSSNRNKCVILPML